MSNTIRTATDDTRATRATQEMTGVIAVQQERTYVDVAGFAKDASLATFRDAPDFCVSAEQLCAADAHIETLISQGEHPVRAVLACI